MTERQVKELIDQYEGDYEKVMKELRTMNSGKTDIEIINTIPRELVQQLNFPKTTIIYTERGSDWEKIANGVGLMPLYVVCDFCQTMIKGTDAVKNHVSTKCVECGTYYDYCSLCLHMDAKRKEICFKH